MNVVFGNKIRLKISLLLRRTIRNLGRRREINVFDRQNTALSDRIEAAYVINLDRQRDRWMRFKKEAIYQKVKGGHRLLDFCIRISAIDGKLLKLGKFFTPSVDNIYSLNDQYFVDPDPRLLSIIREKNIDVDMTSEEIAVALSHIKVWQRIVDERVSYALILEDDVFFENAFAREINRVWQELPNSRSDGFKFDLLYLSYREVDRGAEIVHFSRSLNCPVRGLWWLSGYVLSYSGARKLLEALPVIGPVDLWINRQFCNLDVYSTKSSIIYQREDLESDNNYSILPVLSRAGIQSNETHLILEERKGKNPVFVIGLNEAATNIMYTALSLLGYRCCIEMRGEFSDSIEQRIRNGEPLLFDAYISIKSIAENFQKLDNSYPDAVFILAVGVSRSGGEKSNKRSLVEKRPKVRDPVDVADINQRTQDEMLEYFKVRNNKLLTFDASAKGGWKTLCRFLSCTVPDYPFPQCMESKNPPDLTSLTSSQIPIAQRKLKVLEHDVHPWIVPYEKLSSFDVRLEERRIGNRIGCFRDVVDDDFGLLDNSQWKILEDSFPSNQARFQKGNVSLMNGQGIGMTIRKEISGDKDYSSGSIVSKEVYQFGRFEVEMKPAKLDGVISAFFLHRNDPWQEIDFEFLGRDTTKMLVNVYFNPGQEGVNCNFGNRGTPIIIDLNFDAAEAFHEYAIEWEPHEIRWYVDNQLVHVRSNWGPSPIPDLPMQLYLNCWPTRSEELAGKIDSEKLPVNSYVRSVTISSWSTNFHEGN